MKSQAACMPSSCCDTEEGKEAVAQLQVMFDEAFPKGDCKLKCGAAGTLAASFSLVLVAVAAVATNMI